MKKFFPALMLLFVCASPALAWNCPSGQHRVQAPAGTPKTAPFYDVVEGIAFICESDTPPTDPKTPSQTQSQNQNQSQTQNSSNNNSVNSQNTNKNSNTNTSSSNSSANSNSTSSSGVTNSGNSASTASNNSSGNQTSFSSSYQDVRQTPMAYAPDAAFTTSPCIKGFSAGFSLPGGAGTGGFSKTDKGCDARQTAVIFHALGNDTAAAKLLCSTDASKRANLTLTDCLAIVHPAVPQIVFPQPASQPSPTFNIVLPVPAPAPVPVAVVTPPVVERKQVLTSHVKRVCKSSVKVRDIGQCILVNGKPNNICAPVLDNAINALALDTRAKIVLTGPVESATVVPYLRKHVKASRIEIRLVDEQTATLSVFTETGE